MTPEEFFSRAIEMEEILNAHGIFDPGCVGILIAREKIREDKLKEDCNSICHF